jgi:glycosyltransferase involved in cell wall biosynthesis
MTQGVAPKANAEKTLRILAFAYACEPEKGSEPEAGWVWVRMLTKFGHVHVVTRANNRDAIECGLRNAAERNRLHFVYVDLPRWGSFWKRGQRGVRLYYVLWQVSALRAARRLERRRCFDLVWHLTLANLWLGSLAPLLRAPFVLGPVGGGVGTVWSLAFSFGLRGLAREVTRELVRQSGRYVNPLARLAWRRASVILVQNAETLEWLPRQYRDKAIVFPHAVALESRASIRSANRERRALFAGRLIAWKGAALAVRALRWAPEWSLTVCGSGEEERRLRSLARHLGVSDRVEFRGWTPRDELARLMANSDALLLPSVHDDSPLAVTEALSTGLPVVCLDRGGPPVLGGKAAVIARGKGSEDEIAAELAVLLQSAIEPGRRDVAYRRAAELSFDSRAEEIARVLARVSP